MLFSKSQFNVCGRCCRKVVVIDMSINNTPTRWSNQQVGVDRIDTLVSIEWLVTRKIIYVLYSLWHGDHLRWRGRYTNESSGPERAGCRQDLDVAGARPAQAAGSGFLRWLISTMPASASAPVFGRWCPPRQLMCACAGRGPAPAPALVADAKQPCCINEPYVAPLYLQTAQSL